jgi:hypothetical protein
VSPFFLKPIRAQVARRLEGLRYNKIVALGRGLEFPVRRLPVNSETGGRWIQSVALRVNGIAGAQNLANDASRRGSTSMLGGSANRQVRQVLKPLESWIQNWSSRDVFHMHHF